MVLLGCVRKDVGTVVLDVATGVVTGVGLHLVDLCEVRKIWLLAHDISLVVDVASGPVDESALDPALVLLVLEPVAGKGSQPFGPAIPAL